LSAVGDVDKMADDAARLLMDEKLRREMGRRARALATSRYSTDLIIPKYIEFYESVLNSHPIAVDAQKRAEQIKSKKLLT